MGNKRKLAYSNLWEPLSQKARQTPDKFVFTHLVDGEEAEENISFHELDKRARAIGAVLQDIADPGDRVIMLYPPGLDFIAGLYGCFYAGVIAVPLYPPQPGRIRETLPQFVKSARDAQAKIILCNQMVYSKRTFLKMMSGGIRGFKWINTSKVDQDAVSAWKDPGTRPEDLAFLMYTSGSMGSPKGVMLSHQNLGEQLSGYMEFRAGSGVDPNNNNGVCWLPPYHITGLVMGILFPIWSGSTNVLLSPLDFLAHPIRWLKAVSRYKVIGSGGPNFAYDLCVDRISPEEKGSLDLSHWKYAIIGSETVRSESLKRFAECFGDCGFQPESFMPMYGLTEAGMIVSGIKPRTIPKFLTPQGETLNWTHENEVKDPESTKSIWVSNGQALSGVQFKIVDPESRKPCKPGQVGEVWVSGKGVAKSYWNLPEKTEKTFSGFLTGSGEGPYLRTGDLGLIKEGELFLTGRLKEMIIIRGLNYYPVDIEQTVEKAHPSLRKGCGAAFSIEIEEEERIAIVQEVDSVKKSDLDEIINSIRNAISLHYQIQVATVVLIKAETIPRTESKKIKHLECRKQLMEGKLKIVKQWHVGKGEMKSPKTKIPHFERDHNLPELGSAEGESTKPRQREEIQSWLVTNLAERLKISPEEIETNQPFANYGLESEAAVSLAVALEAWIGRTLSPTLAWEYPTIDSLSSFLAGEVPDVSDSYSFSVAPPQVKEPIAIIGMACRFPGAKDLNAYWDLLYNKKDAITEVPPERWDINDLYDPDPAVPGKMTTRWGGFLDNIDQFDAAFFNISPHIAARMDPRQRLVMEVAWEALEDAGQVPGKTTGRSGGVFIGAGNNEYVQFQARDIKNIDAYLTLGNSNSIIANALTYFLDLQGPSFALDAACSASLVAVHLACQSLWNEECRFALAGGTNLTLSPQVTISFSKAAALAPDGRCKTFDASANGFVRSEGVGMVVLKPLSQAQREGDRIYAIIRGSGVNTDGRRNGMMAPNPQTQKELLRKVYPSAGVAPNGVQYIEAHGTGTALGDPIEAKALGEIISKGRPTDRPCLIGSVKTNIGHTEATAGVAGLIKLALSLKHGILPASLHFKEGNPLIPFQELGLKVQTETSPWPKEPGQRALAGISAFAFGGTNAHVVLEEAPSEPTVSQETPKTSMPYPVVLSSKTPEGLRSLAESYTDWLEKQGSIFSLRDLSYTTCLRRVHHEHRTAFTVQSPQDFQEQLANFPESQNPPKKESKLAFVFTGQGPKWSLCKKLLEQEPVFRETLEKCDHLWGQFGEGRSLIEELTKDPSESCLHRAQMGQPALFSVQIALANLWRAWGIRPDGVVGHSVGEIAAAHVAGILNLKDALNIVYHRSRIHQKLTGQGRMLAVGLPPEKALSLIEKYQDVVSLAAQNSPTSSVLSGDPEALQEIMSKIEGQDIFCRMLDVEYAYHSHQMEPYRRELAQSLGEIEAKEEIIPFYSTVTGEKISGKELGADYWGRNFREPVQFAKAIESLSESQHEIFLELGAHPLLARSIKDVLEHSGRKGITLASLRMGMEGRQTLLNALGDFYSHGFDVNWANLFPPGGKVISLPHYPWQKQSHWFGDRMGGTTTQNFKDYLYEQQWKPVQGAHGETVSGSNGKGSWLIFNDSGKVGTGIAKLLKKNKESSILVDPGKKYKKQSSGRWTINPDHSQDLLRLLTEQYASKKKLCQGIIYLWSLNGLPFPPRSRVPS